MSKARKASPPLQALVRNYARLTGTGREDLADIIAYGLFLFDRLSQLDADIHARFFAEGFDEAQSRRLTELYDLWVKSSLTHLKEVSKQAFEVEGAARLEKECFGIMAALKADGDFFAGPGHDRLVKEALAEHRRGETTEFHEMGQ